MSNTMTAAYTKMAHSGSANNFHYIKKKKKKKKQDITKKKKKRFVIYCFKDYLILTRIIKVYKI
jgi:hypothetical protein